MQEYDIVLVGATGFTGNLVARWLYAQSEKDLRWAIAGRSQQKLEACRDSLTNGEVTRKVPALLVVDTMQALQCRELAAKTKVVITTVGPYSLLGEGLIAACAQTGAHYCDLTGEIPFVKRMIEKYEKAAKESGSIIICCSGFDSVPVDLTNYAVAKYIRQKYSRGTMNARTLITRIQGGVSGGTLASLLGLLDAFSLREVSAAHAPWSISTHKGSPVQRNLPHVTWDKDMKMYGASWVGDNVDRSVAARSWSLLDYGQKWTTYGYLGFSAAYKAYFYLALLYTGAILLGIRPIRYLLKKVAVQPGQGPSQQDMDSGYMEMKCIGESDDHQGHRAVATLSMPHADPGYKGTAIILACVGLTLASNVKSTEAGKRGGGFWTPACLGEPLIGRLADSGVSLRVEDY